MNVLRACIPYLIAFGIVLAAAVVVMIICRKKGKAAKENDTFSISDGNFDSVCGSDKHNLLWTHVWLDFSCNQQRKYCGRYVGTVE